MGSEGDEVIRPAAIAEGAAVKLELEEDAVQSDWRGAPITDAPSPDLPSRRSASAEAAALKAFERE